MASTHLFRQEQGKILLSWNYEIARDVDRSQMIGEFEDFTPYEPNSQAFRAFVREGMTKKGALEWLVNPKSGDRYAFSL